MLDLVGNHIVGFPTRRLNNYHLKQPLKLQSDVYIEKNDTFSIQNDKSKVHQLHLELCPW